MTWAFLGFLVSIAMSAVGIWLKVRAKSATDEAEQVGELRTSDNAERVIANTAEKQAENNAASRDATDVANRLRHGKTGA